MSAIKQIVPNVYTWSKFSEEKQLDFNGTLLTTDGSSVLIDPVEMTEKHIEDVRAIGLPEAIIITNKDHRRAVLPISKIFDVPIWIHEADEKLIDCNVDKTFKNGALLPLNIVAIHLENLKSPGETALYWQKDGGIMIIGDAVIGKPAGSISLLPVQKVPYPSKAYHSLNQLLKFKFDKLILGDGESILSNAHDVLSKFLSQKI